MFNFFRKAETEVKKPQAYIFIGRSGSGKGTQAELLIKKIKESGSKTLHVETGAFFRDFIKRNLYTEVLAKKIVESGGLMPEAIAIHMWVSYLVDNFTGKEELVFDGAPRKLMEAELLDGVLKFYNIVNYKVIYINVGHDWSKDRLLGRGRKDDSEAGIEKRLEWFNTEVMPSVEFFKNNKDCHFIDVNGEQAIEQVHDEIIRKVFKL